MIRHSTCFRAYARGRRVWDFFPSPLSSGKTTFLFLYKEILSREIPGGREKPDVNPDRVVAIRNRVSRAYRVVARPAGRTRSKGVSNLDTRFETPRQYNKAECKCSLPRLPVGALRVLA